MPPNPFAFPGPDQTTVCESIHEGMTLRDYFAAKAMQAAMGHSASRAAFLDMAKDDGVDKAARAVADHSYRIADAMLAARHK